MYTSLLMPQLAASVSPLHTFVSPSETRLDGKHPPSGYRMM